MIEVKGLEPFCGKRARVLRSELEPELSDHIGSELNGLLVPARALQVVRDLAPGFDCHGRVGSTVTNRPVQGRSGSLEGRIGVQVHTRSGATGSPGYPIAKR